MYRIACLRIPRFQIAVQQKHEPLLTGKPFVLLAETPIVNERSGIIMCSNAAGKKRIVPGMKLSQAQAIETQLVWRVYNEKLYAQAEKELAQILINCSPKVKALEPGIFLLDACGLKNMGGEDKFCLTVLKQASKAGYTEGCIGIADTAFAAIIASKYKRKRWYVVPQASDKEFLAPLSLAHLPLAQDVEEALLALGIKTMGQLANFPLASLSARFGNDIIKAHDLALGKDKRKPELPTKELYFSAHMELSAPLESLNQTLFVLKSMLDRLIKELTQADLLVEELVLSLANENEVIDKRPIKLIRPSKHNKFLLEVIKLSLEAKPAEQEFTQVKLVVSRFCPNDWEQLGVNESATQALARAPHEAPLQSRAPTRTSLAPTALLAGAPHAASVYQTVSNAAANKTRDELSSLSPNLLLLLQRFTTRLGEKALVYPLANDNYLPDNNGIWVSVLESPEPTINKSYLETTLGVAGLTNGLVCKYLPSAIPVLVEFNNTSPIAIFYQQKWRHIKQITTPECLSSSWWDKPVQKSYYQALLEERSATNLPDTLVLLVREHKADAWFIEGFFD